LDIPALFYKPFNAPSTFSTIQQTYSLFQKCPWCLQKGLLVPENLCVSCKLFVLDLQKIFWALKKIKSFKDIFGAVNNFLRN
jgi:hypothetical protein